MNMKKIKSLLPYIISLLTAVLMTLAAELTGEKEIIFPEITAIAVGALAAPKQAWNTSRLRLLLTITASAVLGVGIVRFVPLPLVFQVPLGIAAAFICIALSRTEFVPAVNGRGFEIKADSQEKMSEFLSEYSQISDAEKNRFFSQWLSFDTYRRVVFKSEEV